MRSRLEARWARLLDLNSISWAYEPELIRLGKGRGASYVPDFYLPDQRAWLEVKGPHWERFEKTRSLSRRLGTRGLVLVATASGVCWRVPPSGKPSGEEVRIGLCPCGVRALGVPIRGTLICRAPGCGVRDVKAEGVLGW